MNTNNLNLVESIKYLKKKLCALENSIGNFVPTGIVFGGSNGELSQNTPDFSFNNNGILNLRNSSAGSQSRLEIDTWNQLSVIIGRRANGTREAPTALNSGDIIFAVQSRPFGDTWYGNAPTRMEFIASETITDSSRGTDIIFKTVLNGGITANTAFGILNNNVIISHTYGGGSKTATALTKNLSNYLQGYATDGSHLEVTIGGSFVDDTAASGGGVAVGEIYYNTTSNKLKTRMT